MYRGVYKGKCGSGRDVNMGVVAEKVSCSKCLFASDYSAVRCRCGEFLGYPNFRAAEAERPELEARYQAARADAGSRGVESLLDQLETLADAALPVIAVPLDVCDLLLRGAKYETYSQRVARKDRPPPRGKRITATEWRSTSGCFQIMASTLSSRRCRPMAPDSASMALLP